METPNVFRVLTFAYLLTAFFRGCYCKVSPTCLVRLLENKDAYSEP